MALDVTAEAEAAAAKYFANQKSGTLVSHLVSAFRKFQVDERERIADWLKEHCQHDESCVCEHADQLRRFS